jgi:hypothetical protein
VHQSNRAWCEVHLATAVQKDISHG